MLDYSVQAAIYPTEKLNFLTAVHWFDRASRGDVIYNVANAPFGTVATTSRNIGSELDLVLNYKVNDRLNVHLLYTWFWYGGFVVDDPAITRDDASQFYVQTQVRY